jgi:hypothetical protein
VVHAAGYVVEVAATTDGRPDEKDRAVVTGD